MLPAHDNSHCDCRSKLTCLGALDSQALGFQSAINPGRMIRVLHTLVRTLLITLRVRPSPFALCCVFSHEGLRPDLEKVCVCNSHTVHTLRCVPGSGHKPSGTSRTAVERLTSFSTPG